ncbi:hybrid sensor histidine kinase/response regulator [Schlesneria paludicola]|uniref:hybrid sensor histidine kinase/response regulator n=1 Tax=Schlesneria paludicola TaxID=360056 RepID=UPI000299CF32|nr:ATP-binding protein [Schlesneria paludicola]
MTMSNGADDLADLHRRLEEAEETLRAIRSGEVDALIVDGNSGNKVIYTLHGADYPYRELIEAMQQGATSLSSDGTVLYCNRFLIELLEVAHEKVIGHSLALHIAPSQRTAFDRMLHEGRTGKCQGELDFQLHDGRTRPVLVSLAPLPLDFADAICMVVTDLTDHKKHQDLQEANRRKDEFLAMLAHELRNPLAPIQNAVVILKHLGLADENVRYAHEIIDRQVHHLSRLVDDLLDVSRITLGKVKLQRQPIELNAIISRAVEASRPFIDNRRHQITVSLPPKGIRVDADQTRLTQILGNLLSNAAKYMNEGGEIFLTTDHNPTEVAIRVRDTGIGISADFLPRVFDLFIQGDRSMARSEGGLGIGLTLVRRLVEMHGGSVEAFSNGLDQGSEFVVRLPILSDGQKNGESDAALDWELRSEAKRRVLVIEDNKDGADTLAMLLRMMGHEVQIAYSGAEGIRVAGGFGPDVILLDIGLPGICGYDVAKTLRLQPEFEHTVFIAMTGYGQDDDKQRSLEAGFSYHFVKPLNPKSLAQILEIPGTGEAISG